MSEHAPDVDAAGLAGLVVDYGGVLTTPLQHTMAAWAESDGIDVSEFTGNMKKWFGSSYGPGAETNAVHALERGEIEIPHFEAQLAARLTTRDGRPVPAEGLLRRMFAGFEVQQSMLAALRAARANGLRVALLSNSWGMDYPREGWDELFDAVVISGEVGMRKPEPGIYRRAADDLGLAPQQCVMVDDLPSNIEGAAAVGMVGLVHVEPEQTIADLEGLFRVSLRP